MDGPPRALLVGIVRQCPARARPPVKTLMLAHFFVILVLCVHDFEGDDTDAVDDHEDVASEVAVLAH
eukprot:EC797488.1.p4 GENE.EC797488.1~~EC797488.1.p4  ORF type:complete len:67 (+),score=16.92 EC797488.1:416-616(+)